MAKIKHPRRARPLLLFLCTRERVSQLDEIRSAVVAAADAKAARDIISGAAMDEGRGAWLDESKAAVEKIGTAVHGTNAGVFVIDAKGF